MNRREFLAAGFKLGAAGLLLPAIEPVRRYWSLDRTMVPTASYTTGWFDMAMPDPNVLYVTDTAVFSTGDLISIDREQMMVVRVDGKSGSITVIRDMPDFYAAVSKVIR